MKAYFWHPYIYRILPYHSTMGFAMLCHALPHSATLQRTLPHTVPYSTIIYHIIQPCSAMTLIYIWVRLPSSQVVRVSPWLPSIAVSMATCVNESCHWNYNWFMP